VPLILSSGPGSEIRRAMGVTVFSGMMGVTLFGLVLTPVFYVALRSIVRRVHHQPPKASATPLDAMPLGPP
jgi:multidrug efflux pump